MDMTEKILLAGGLVVAAVAAYMVYQGVKSLSQAGAAVGKDFQTLATDAGLAANNLNASTGAIGKDISNALSGADNAVLQAVNSTEAALSSAQKAIYAGITTPLSTASSDITGAIAQTQVAAAGVARTIEQTGGTIYSTSYNAGYATGQAIAGFTKSVQTDANAAYKTAASAVQGAFSWFSKVV